MRLLSWVTPMVNSVISFLKAKQVQPPQWKIRVETDPRISRLVDRVATDAMTSILSSLADSMPSAGPYLAENYVRPIAKTKAMADGQYPASMRRLLHAYLKQFERVPTSSIQRAQVFLSQLGSIKDLLRSGVDVLAHCPSCGILAAGSAKRPATTECECGSSTWILQSHEPRSVLANFLRDDFFLELIVSAVLAKQIPLLTTQSERKPVACSVSYQSSPRDVELDVVGYNDRKILIIEARTNKIRVNDVTQKRGQILELLSEFGAPTDLESKNISLVFVSPVPHDKSIDTRSYRRIRPLPVFFITGVAVDSLDGGLGVLTGKND
jgi:hypothetical protein